MTMLIATTAVVTVTGVLALLLAILPEPYDLKATASSATNADRVPLGRPFPTTTKRSPPGMRVEEAQENSNSRPNTPPV